MALAFAPRESERNQDQIGAAEAVKMIVMKKGLKREKTRPRLMAKGAGFFLSI